MINKKDREGSFFCENCEKEYENVGWCECGGRIVFVSINDPKYLKLVMKSNRKVPDEPKLSYTRPFHRDNNSKEENKWL